MLKGIIILLNVVSIIRMKEIISISRKTIKTIIKLPYLFANY